MSPSTTIPSRLIPSIKSPVSKQLTEKELLLKKVADTIKEYDGESNIPISHDYWNWLNQYRRLQNEGK